VERSTATSRSESAAEAAGATAAPDLDRTVLDTTLRESGDASLGPQLAQLFEQESHRALGRLRDAIGAGDGDGVARAAHGMKGSAATLGAARVAALALVMERAGREARLGDAAALIDDVDIAVEAASRALHLAVGV
jgi:HPt (histidine-containing phosphotransfer) domain-containing protein